MVMSGKVAKGAVVSSWKGMPIQNGFVKNLMGKQLLKEDLAKGFEVGDIRNDSCMCPREGFMVATGIISSKKLDCKSMYIKTDFLQA